MTSIFKQLRQHLFAAASLLIIATPTLAEEQFLDRIVAIVNSDIIMLSELDSRTAIIRQQLISRGTPLPPAKTLHSQVLDKMISDKLQLAAAEFNGIRVSDQLLNQTLEKIAASNGLNLYQFKQQLEADGQVYAEVRNQIREEMLITRARQQLVNRRIKVTDQEVKNFLASEQGQAQVQEELHLANIMIPIPSKPSTEQVRQAEATIKKVYEDLSNGADFAEVSVAVSKSPKALEGGDLGWRKSAELPANIQAAVKDLKAGQISKPFRLGGAFQVVKLIEKRGGATRMVQKTKARHILIKESKIRTEAEAEKLARSLRTRILSGEDFGELAKQYSDDTGSGSLGGELGWALPGQMVPSFDEMMNRTDIGKISPVFKSRFGWHFLEVQDRNKEDLGERIIANQAKETIRQRKFNEELINWVSELRAEAYIERKL